MTSTTADVASSRRGRGLLLVSLAGIIWGTMGPGVQVTYDVSGLAPLTISAYRVVVALAVLVVALLVTDRLRSCWSLARQQWRRVIIVGLLTAAFQMLFFVAVVAAGVSVTTVVCLGFAPVLLLFVSGAQRRRLPSGGHTLTVLIAVVGLLLVSLVGGGSEEPASPVLGTLAAIGAGAAYGLSAEVAAPLTQRLDILTVTTATMSVAAVLVVPGGLVSAYLRGQALTTTDPASWLLLIYLGVVTTAIAYALLFTGLRTTPSGSAVIATLLEPVTAVLIAVAFLDEHLTVAGVVGCLLILTAIASLGRDSDAPPPQ